MLMLQLKFEWIKIFFFPFHFAAAMQSQLALTALQNGQQQNNQTTALEHTHKPTNFFDSRHLTSSNNFEDFDITSFLIDQTMKIDSNIHDTLKSTTSLSDNTPQKSSLTNNPSLPYTTDKRDKPKPFSPNYATSNTVYAPVTPRT